MNFSPDGSHILVQNEAGFFVLTTDPLAVKFWIPAPNAVSPRFSGGSSTVNDANQLGRVGGWKLSDGKQILDRRSDQSTYWLAAALSPDGEILATLDSDMRLHVSEFTTGKEIPLKLPARALTDYPVRVSIPEGRPSAYSVPMGYRPSALYSEPLDKGRSEIRLDFSPDGRYLIATELGPPSHQSNPWRVYTGNPWGAWMTEMTLVASPGKSYVVDLAIHEKLKLSEPMQKYLNAGLAFVAPGVAAVSEGNNQEEFVLLTFPEGRALEKIDCPTRPSATSDPRYTVCYSNDGTDPKLLDIKTGKTVESVPGLRVDVLGDKVASISADSQIVISSLSGGLSQTPLTLPASRLPELTCPAASDELTTLVLGASQEGGIFNTRTGQRVLADSGFLGAWFASPNSWFLAQSTPSRPPEYVVKEFAESGGEAISQWPMPELIPQWQEYFLTGSLVTSFKSSNNLRAYDSSILEYELRVVDVLTAKELWTRKFAHEVPIPFLDPEGERTVLAWNAATPGASKVAKLEPSVRKEMASVGDRGTHTLFEVVDAKTGITVGGVLDQRRLQPQQFDVALSRGGWLVNVRNQSRTTVFSLTSGEVVVRVYGSMPRLSTASSLLSVVDNKMRMQIYDLSRGGQKRGELQFSDKPVYSHFSMDGKRILVLTQDQNVYVLDLDRLPLQSLVRLPH